MDSLLAIQFIWKGSVNNQQILLNQLKGERNAF